MRKNPSLRLLRRLFICDPQSGKLIWRERPNWMFAPNNFSGKRETNARRWNKVHAGREALTSVGTHGYRNGSIFATWHLAHRIIWTMANGRWPEEDIDHIDGNRLNNAISNLRSVSRQENTKNLSRRPLNTSGVPGVIWNKRSRKWRASIKVSGKFIYLGHFENLEAAALARKIAEAQYGFHPNHGRPPQ